MSKLLVFAGTTEGRELITYLTQHQIEATAYVATDYGVALLEESAYVEVRQGRLDAQEMQALLETKMYHKVIDATHPYAEVVTHHIQKACKATGIPYKRVIRKEEREEDVISVKTTEEAASYLSQTEGTILLTTGSKTLESFTCIADYAKRIYVRLLPMPCNIEKCIALGFQYSHLLAMQGPFSYEMNKALLQHTKAQYLVTKDSGEPGGVKEKIEAAKAMACQVIVIERPQEESGYTLEQIIKELN